MDSFLKYEAVKMISFYINIALIISTPLMGLVWGVLHLKMIMEEDTNKLVILEDARKKSMMATVLSVSMLGIVGSIYLLAK